MSKSVIDAKCFHSEEAAYQWVEARIWPNGPVCPHCGNTKSISRMQGKSTRYGLLKCYAKDCRKPFRATVGTVFESSRIPLRLWLQALFLMCSSKKGISSNQLHRILGVTLKTAWFMSHRLRLAMSQMGVEPMGGDGEIVEADETFLFRKAGQPKARGGYQHKMVILSLVQRGGELRSFVIDRANKPQIEAVLRKHVSPESRLVTDAAPHYRGGMGFKSHESVNHQDGEYVRGDVHTNTLESYYSVFKRGMRGVYQHCAEKHLHRYVGEFDFRYNNRVALGIGDVARTEQAIRGIVGKRLTYRTTN
jgi:transposase-like protein